MQSVRRTICTTQSCESTSLVYLLHYSDQSLVKATWDTLTFPTQVWPSAEGELRTTNEDQGRGQGVQSPASVGRC